MKLLIAIPSNRDWKSGFNRSFTSLVMNLGKNKVDAQFSLMSGVSCLSRGRQDALKYAQDNGYTHLLMLDDDMVFPEDLVLRLAAHIKPVVAFNYRKKTPDKVEGVCMDLKGQLINECGVGLQPVDYIGFGAVLIDLASMDHVKAPHFEVRWLEDKQAYLSEDLYFSRKLRSEGVEMFVDHDLSSECGHIGDFEYKFPKQQRLKEVA